MGKVFGMKNNAVEEIEVLFADKKAGEQITFISTVESAEELEALKADAKPSALKEIEKKIAELAKK